MNQIRLHDSYDTHFFVYTTSKLIIEDCSRVFFHELQHQYEGLERDLEVAQLKGTNLWKEVQDFKWIKVEKSPNFSLVYDGKEKEPEQEAMPVIHNAPLPQPKPTDKKPGPALDARFTHDLSTPSADFSLSDAFLATPGESVYKVHQVQLSEKPVEKKELPKVEPAPPQAETVAAAEDDEIDEI
jgi:hypothetical protein